MAVDKKLIAIKAHYFLTKGGAAPVAPFLPLIGKSLGFSSFMTGVAYTGVSVASVFMKMSFGALFSKCHCQKIIFLGLIIIQLLSYFGVQYVPPLPGNSTTSVVCQNETNLNICSERIISEDFIVNFTSTHSGKNLYCMLKCRKNDLLVQKLVANKSESEEKSSSEENDYGFYNETYEIPTKSFRKEYIPVKISLEAESLIYKDQCLILKINWLAYHGFKWFNPSCENELHSSCQFYCGEILYNIIKPPKIEDKEIPNYYQFWSFFSIIAIGSAASAINAQSSNALCLNLLDDTNLFGNQMLWGSLGCGLVSIISGFAIDKLSTGSPFKDLSVAFYISLFILILDFLVSTKIEDEKEDENDEEIQEQGEINDILNFMNLSVFVFTMWCILIGLYTSIVDNFLFWYLEDVVDASGGDMSLMKTLEGLILTVNAYLGDMPSFLLSGWLLGKIGHAHSMTLVLLAFGIRFILYSYITNPWWSLPVGILNGITFGMYHSTKNFFCSFIPHKSKTTFDSFLTTHYDGLGVSLGSTLGGYLMQTYGGSILFWYFGLSALSFTVLNFIVHLGLKKPDIKENESPGQKNLNESDETSFTQNEGETDEKN